MSSAGSRSVRVAFNGGSSTTVQIDEARPTITLPVILRPGFNRVELAPTEPAQRMSQERGHLRSFAVHETAVVLADQTTTSHL